MITRRRFLAGAGVAGAGAAAMAHTPVMHALGLGASAATPSSAGHGTLVLVAMYGGNDGLNTLVPVHDPAYPAGRPTLGWQPGDVIPLDADFGLHPSLKGMKGLWDSGTLAIVRGVGYPQPNYSHFRSMSIWQTASPDTVESTGWLGRMLDHAGEVDPLTALAIGPTLPQLLQGANTAGASIPTGSLTLPGGTAVEKYYQALEQPGSPGLLGQVARSGADLLTVIHAVKTTLAASPSTAPAATGNAVAGQLDLVARLITGGLGTRVYVVTAPGYDTHGDEKATQQRLLADLDTAVSSFVHRMAASPHGRDVVLMTFSEFGRRVAENGSGGTDHGSAAPLFVAGPGVRGGYYGEEPSLTDLDDGNLKFTTDFRSVYATVAERVLGIDPATVLLGKSFPTLPFVV